MMNVRETKGLCIAATSNIQQQGDVWLVPSEHTNKKYTVLLGQHPTCSCPDFETRRQPCKHIFAAERILHPQPILEPVASVRRPTYKQEWHEYNLAQTTEKARLLELLYELCAGIEEPVQTFGRPRLSFAEMLFCAVYKIYSTFSSRRFISDLQIAKERGYISKVPHFNSVSNYLESEAMTAYLKELIIESSRPLASIEWDFAVDSSGFSIGRNQHWADAKWNKEQKGDGSTTHVNKQDWIKVHLMCGCKTNIVTSVEVTDSHAGDSPRYIPLVEQTSKNFTMDSVCADKAYSASPNLQLTLVKGAVPYIPFRSNTRGDDKRQTATWKRMFHFFSYNQEMFMRHYHKRSNVETTFSMIKSKFGEKLRSKTKVAQTNEVLCKVLAHNICCLVQSIYELGVEPTFWTQSSTGAFHHM
ncbi:MAG TPA: transposase [Pyrinomonadaceae bacterium]|jgi:transposase